FRVVTVHPFLQPDDFPPGHDGHGNHVKSLDPYVPVTVDPLGQDPGQFLFRDVQDFCKHSRLLPEYRQAQQTDADSMVQGCAGNLPAMPASVPRALCEPSNRASRGLAVSEANRNDRVPTLSHSARLKQHLPDQLARVSLTLPSPQWRPTH